MPGYNLPTDVSETRLDEELEALSEWTQADMDEAYERAMEDKLDYLLIDARIEAARMKGWWEE